MPPSDPRYLSMTDDEIYFDYITVTRSLEVAEAELDQKDAVQEETPALPEFQAEDTGGPNKSRKMAFSSDQNEFRRWFEEEIGPWNLTRSV